MSGSTTRPGARLQGFVNKEVPLRFKGAGLSLKLSHALFSSNDIDTGTTLLLKALARIELPRGAIVIDSGCGTGPLCLALKASRPDLRVIARDRDSLACAFTAMNARANGIKAMELAPEIDPLKHLEEACVKGDEPPLLVQCGLLLDEPPGASDLIVSNVPAKAGPPVLEAFFKSLPLKLAAGGKAAIVIVNTLARDARAWIEKAGAPIFAREEGPGHEVLVFGRPQGALPCAESFTPALMEASSWAHPAYMRAQIESRLLGNEGPSIPLVTYYGLSGFDTPSIEEVLTAKLIAGRAEARGNLGPCHVHAPGQGHLASLLCYPRVKGGFGVSGITLTGRDLLALRASGANVRASSGVAARLSAIPSLECFDGLDSRLGLACIFPELCPGRDWVPEAWGFAEGAVRSGGILVAATSSTEAARLLKRKSAVFSRVADIRRLGRRAMLFRRLN